MGGFGLLNLIPQLPDFAGKGLDYGIWRRMRNNYASQVRHLRRREYQDMVFSMKQAGLNPILAVGAQPGHSAAMMGSPESGSPGAGLGTAWAANEQARASNRQARVKEVLTPYEVGESMMRRYQAAEQMKLTSASTELTRAQVTKTLNEGATEAIRRLLVQKQAEREGWSAQKIAEEVRQYKMNYNVPPWNLIGGDAHNLGEKAGAAAASALDWMRNNNLDQYKGGK